MVTYKDKKTSVSSTNSTSRVQKSVINISCSMTDDERIVKKVISVYHKYDINAKGTIGLLTLEVHMSVFLTLEMSSVIMLST